MSTKWTLEEIESLRTLYLRGFALKEIGLFVNKTSTAVNKALSRFNIRPGKKPKSQKKTLPETAQTSKMETSQLVRYINKILNVPVQITDDDVLVLNGHVITREQLLYRINKHRIKHRLPIFEG